MNEQSDLFGPGQSENESTSSLFELRPGTGSNVDNHQNKKARPEPTHQELLEPESIATATPSMKQFLTIRKKYPESYLLFYRMGDFYELFFHDAERAAKSLSITLTQRGKHLGHPVRMCGVPVVSAEAYLQRLIVAGFRVVICEQLEDAKKGTPVVKRGVVRLVTPGTITEDALLEAERNHYILCLFSRRPDYFSLAWADVSTGSFVTQSGDINETKATIERLGAEEVVVSDAWLADETQSSHFTLSRNALTPLAKDRFNLSTARHVLLKHYHAPTTDIFGIFSDDEIIAAGTLLDYIISTQAGGESQLQTLKRNNSSDYMVLSPEALHSLEIRGPKKSPSLISYVNLCQTAAGSRLVYQWILQPLMNKEAIEARHGAIAFFMIEAPLSDNLRNHFRHLTDGERALTRLLLQRGNPRDMASLGFMLDATSAIFAHLSKAKPFLPPLCQSLTTSLDPCDSLRKELSIALNNSLPTHIRHGGVFAPGYSSQLDAWRDKKQECARLIQKLARKYRQQTGIERLSISRNNMIGCYIEVPQRFAAMIPDSFQHKQTTSQSLRYHTDELEKLNQDAVHTGSNALHTEQELFGALVSRVRDIQDRLRTTCAVLAQFDVLLAWARLAEQDQLIQPRIVEEPVLIARNARHPLVARHIRSRGGDFIANDLNLTHDSPVILLTGPNMAGKSTYLRQAALLVVLAQSGCYVPAEDATIGITDRVMTRIGATDDISHGKSTFMVEMMESASILHQATSRSLLILDELGRGTSTYDGLSLAWAILSHMRTAIECRTLFSTHYQELTQLGETIQGINNFHMQCSVDGETIHFLHAIKEGPSSHSYGHHVARLAGIPAPVVSHARRIHKEFQKTRKPIDDRYNPDEALQSPRDAVAESIIDRLERCQPDALAPRQALELVYDLTRTLAKVHMNAGHDEPSL